jgi:penicillin amidase
MKLIKFFKWIGAVLAAVLVMTVIVAYLMLRASLPERDGVITLEGVRDSVTVTYDRMGIPQVWAKYESDAWFALGWLHASDRLFQMEISRRAASGRLSEILGEETMAIDRLQRTFGHRRMAEEAVKNLDMDTRIRLQAYCNGINAWAEWTGAMPFEFYLAGIDFEPWTPVDCLALFSFQTWYSDALQDNSSFYQKIAEKLGRAAAEQLQPEYPEWAPATVPQEQPEQIKKEKDSIAGQLLRHGLTGLVMASSSNGWVIAPQRSASGSAMLASDPHLDIYRLPQFWYIAGLHASETSLHVLGISTPGMPFIAFGHNGRAAWAFTAGGVRVMDTYEEKVNPENKYQYQTPAGWQFFDKHLELIGCDGHNEPDSLWVLSTRHGPITERRDSLDLVYSVRWAGFDTDLALSAKKGFDLARVSGFELFRQTITGFGALNANWLYADVTGNIGYQLGTPLPVRNWQYTGFRLPGWTDEHEWQGYYPIDKTPHALNPSQGWLASCNNRPASGQYGYDIPGNFAADRILRLRDLLTGQEKFSLADCIAFQQDTRSAFILLWRQDLADALESAGEKDLARRIVAWNGDMGVDSREAALMETWLNNLKQSIFADELPGLKDKLGREEQLRDLVLYNAFHKPYPIWFDDIKTDDEFETREQIARTAVEMAMAETGDREWGNFQSLAPAHPFSVVPVIGWLLDLKRGPFQRGGDAGTLNATFALPDEDGRFTAIAGPSWRFVIDFHDIDAAVMVAPAGQSGHPLDKHFFDFFNLWDKGKMWNVPFSRSKVYARSYAILQFIPEEND